MDTAILLICTERAELLEHSLPLALAQPDAEVTVIDNASADGTRDVALRLGARVLRLDERVGFAAAYNRAIAETEGKAVLLLNDDCFLDPGFLAAARAPLDRPGIGSVAPKLLRCTGRAKTERLDAIDCTGMTVDRRRKNGLAGHGRPALACDRPAPCFGADGAAALYLRSVLADCAATGDVLAEDLGSFASDVDLAWRAQVLGHGCAFEPGALAWHVRTYSPSTRARVPERARREQFRNRWLMIAANDTPATLAPDAIRVLGYEALALGYAVARERHLLAGYGEAGALLGAARRRGRALDAHLRATGRRRAPAPFGVQPPP